jgi:hypothetical protein
MLSVCLLQVSGEEILWAVDAENIRAISAFQSTVSHHRLLQLACIPTHLDNSSPNSFFVSINELLVISTIKCSKD